MTKVDKTLEKWLKNPPKEAPRGEVLAIIKRFFPGQYETKRGSHIVIRDERLVGLRDYGPDGSFDIPVKGGQKVKGFYLKRVARTIKLLEEMEE